MGLVLAGIIGKVKSGNNLFLLSRGKVTLSPQDTCWFLDWFLNLYYEIKIDVELC